MIYFQDKIKNNFSYKFCNFYIYIFQKDANMLLKVKISAVEQVHFDLPLSRGLIFI